MRIVLTAVMVALATGCGAEILGSGWDVIGEGAVCVDPVPSAGGTAAVRIDVTPALPTDLTTTNAKPPYAHNVYLGWDEQWHTANTAAERAVSATNRPHVAYFHYRFRTVDSVTGWSVSRMLPVWFCTVDPVSCPDEPCDMEYYVDGDAWSTYYQYADYSGAGHAKPVGDFSEEPGFPTFSSFHEDVLRPHGANFCTVRSWMRVRGFKSRMLTLGCVTNVVPGRTVTVPGSASDHAPSQDAGYRITRVNFDSAGIGVSFEAVREPPYVVAVYPVRALGLSRRRPLAHVEVTGKQAFVPLSWSVDDPVFVQVGHDLGIGSDLAAAEVAAMRKAKSDVDRFVEKAVNDGPAPDGSGRMHLVGDGVWSGFVPSDSDAISVDVRGRLAVSDPTRPPVVVPAVPDYGFAGATVTNWAYREVSAGGPVRVVFPAGTAATGGSGYRVVLDERNMTVTYSRAHSSEPGRSDEFVIPRPCRTLTVDDGGYGSAYDWSGTEYRQRHTNAVPGRVYVNGL